MIQSVLLIHESGFGLLSRTYGENPRDMDLFSGLFTAISCFAKSLIGDTINEIRMDNHNIFYEAAGGVVLAIITPKRTISRRKMSAVMRKIHTSFLDTYSEYLMRNILDPQIFADFSMEIDSILKKNTIMKKNDFLGQKEAISQISSD
jgi:hypothetical protein